MREDPNLDQRELAAALRLGYGVDLTAARFISGLDVNAAAYDAATDGARAFVKVHLVPPKPAPLEVARALADSGLDVVAPLRTSAGALSFEFRPGRFLVVFPYVDGRNAIEARMSDGQWRAFGTLLRGVHESPIRGRFAHGLPAESFALPSADEVRTAMRRAAERWPASSPASRLAALLRAKAAQISGMLERAATLRRTLSRRRFEPRLCHADAHGGNLLVTQDGRVHLVDWDGAMLAPRERDLLFVIGSRVANTVEPHEEDWFFGGYGSVDVDSDALVYYRYERIFEDIGVGATGVFGGQLKGAAAEAEVQLIEDNFGPGGMVEAVDQI